MARSPLSARTTGAGPRIVLVHGFTQTGRCWDPVARRLDRDHEVVAVDLPGHGGSTDVEPAADLWRCGELTGEVGGPATYIGYSLGGRVCLHLALRRPDLVGALVLVGATGGIDDSAERAERRARDAALAERIETIGVDAFLEEWLGLPLFAGLTSDTDCRDARRVNTSTGLAASLRHTGTGTQEALWDRLGRLTMPVLCVAGEHDAKFRTAAERLAAAIGANATTAIVPGAGHTAHLEQTEAFLAVLRPWLATHPHGNPSESGRENDPEP